MNIEINNQVENEVEVEYVENINYSNNNFKKYGFFMFLGCLVLSFLVWCFANYLDDPIIKKGVPAKFDWDGENTNVVFTIIDSKTGKEIKEIEIYGEKSVLIYVNSISVELSESQFSDGKDIITIKLPLEDGVHSHISEITIKKTEK